MSTLISDSQHDQEYYSENYGNKFNNINLESRGIYITEHDAFTLPTLSKGVFNTEYLGGGKRTYAMPNEKQIALTIKVENAYLSNIDYNLRQVFELFYTKTTAPLILEERPDRHIDCILTGAVSISDTPVYTELQLKLLALFPFFRSNDLFTINPSGILVFEGNATHYPIFTITGPAVDPVLLVSNKVESSMLKYTGSLGVEDKLVIDTLSHTVLLNTSPVTANLSGSIIACQPGANTLELSQGTLTVSTNWFYY